MAGALSESHAEAIAEKYLRVEHVRRDLGRRSVRGGIVLLASNGVQLMLSLGSTAVLARLLIPADFGLLAMVAAVTGLLSALKDFGLPMATVHRKDLDHRQMSSLFWLNLKFNLGLGLVLVALGPLLAWFYSEPRLINITFAVALGFVMVGISLLHLGLLRRQMRFGAYTAVELTGMTTGVAVGIAAASWGAGYWALVLQQLTASVVVAAGLWLACGWRPDVATFRGSTRFAEVNGKRDSSQRSVAEMNVRTMLAYGRELTAARILSYISANLDCVLIGRFAGAGPLGLYQKAAQWAVLPFEQVFFPLQAVAVGSFSRLQDAQDLDRYRAYARKSLLALFTLTLPALVFVFIEAEAVVGLLLGKQWSSAIPLLRLLSVAAFLGSGVQATKWIYLAEGRTAHLLRWMCLATPATILAVLIGLHWGASGVATGYVLVSAILLYPGVRFALSGSKLRPGDLWAPLLRPGVSALLAGAGLTAFRRLVPNLASMAGQFSIDAAIFVPLFGTLWMLTRAGRQEARELYRLASRYWADNSTLETLETQSAEAESPTSTATEAPYWDAVAEAWAKSRPHGLWRAHSDAVNIALLGPWLAGQPAGRLLKTDTFDEAASPGLYPLLARHAEQVHGIDISTIALKAARDRYAQMRITGADVRRLPFAPESFDTVLSNSTLDHFDSRDQISASLCELRRVLRPGGTLLLTLDNLANPLVAVRGCLPFVLLHRMGILPYQVGVSCRPGELREVVEAAGFEVVEITAVMHCPRVVAVAMAGLVEWLGGARTQRWFLRRLMDFERMRRWPTRFRTGHFIAIRAIARPAKSLGEAA